MFYTRAAASNETTTQKLPTKMTTHSTQQPAAAAGEQRRKNMADGNCVHCVQKTVELPGDPPPFPSCPPVSLSLPALLAASACLVQSRVESQERRHQLNIFAAGFFAFLSAPHTHTSAHTHTGIPSHTRTRSRSLCRFCRFVSSNGKTAFRLSPFSTMHQQPARVCVPVCVRVPRL